MQGALQLPAGVASQGGSVLKNFFEVKSIINEELILSELDPELREEIGLYLCDRAVSHNYLFVDLPKGMLLKVGNLDLEAQKPQK